MLEIVKRSHVVNIVQVEALVFADLIAELAHRAPLGVPHVHQLPLLVDGHHEAVKNVADESEMAQVASAVVDCAGLLVEKIIQQSPLSGVGTIHIVEADTCRPGAVGFRELLVKTFDFSKHKILKGILHEIVLQLQCFLRRILWLCQFAHVRA